ncbi:MAG TPA: FAD-dependent oxidoreductase [Candidatus Udaeobacter sp.]|jgi:D-amino-acid oxidase|nr:FAD-dependent oxidoreductase [Candidatus Udaeobacter sp.]
MNVAIIGAGVSGLTCGVLFAECGFRTAILAKEIGQQTTSGAAGAIWFPYDAEPAEKVIPWALATYETLMDLSRDSSTGVSMIEVRQFSRTGDIQISEWAIPLGARPLPSSVVAGSHAVVSSEAETPLAANASPFTSGYSIRVPLTDTTIYLDHLADRFLAAGGSITANAHFQKLEDVDEQFDLVINCAGIGAHELVQDCDLEPHRGQVAVVSKIEELSYAIVCDDAPLMYAIPRTNDCLFGGTNHVSSDLAADPATTDQIVAECSRVLKIDRPKILAERVGLRPFRKSGVRLERDHLDDGRIVIHDYGHGGSGFTLSWGCAREVLNMAESEQL